MAKKWNKVIARIQALEDAIAGLLMGKSATGKPAKRKKAKKAKKKAGRKAAPESAPATTRKAEAEE